MSGDATPVEKARNGRDVLIECLKTRRYIVENLGGIVKGKKRTYRIEVKTRQPPRGVVWINTTYDVSVFDDEMNELVRKQSVKVRPEDPADTLRTFVNMTKHSAENDFM